MFEATRSPFEVIVAGVGSSRYGWSSRAAEPSEGRRLLALDVDSLDSDDALSALVSLAEHEAALTALRARLLVRVAGATSVVRDVLVEGGSVGAAKARTVEIVDEVAAEAAAVLRMAEATLRRDVERARLLAGPLARTAAELAAGRISSAAMTALCEQAARMMTRPLGVDAGVDEAFAESCGRLQDRVLVHARHETPSQVRARARRVVDSIDASAAWERRRRARRGCDVQAWSEDDGLAVILTRLPALHAARVMACVEGLVRTDADRLAAEVSDRTGAVEPTLGQLRAAAFVELVLHGNGVGAVEVQVVIDAATLAGLTPAVPGQVQVGGDLVPVDSDDLRALLTDPSTPVLLRRLVSDPMTGALVDRGAHAYPVSSELAAWIATRDRTCRHPGCTRRATSCDIDHAEPFDEGGATTIANTGALCRRHHNLKTHAGWRIEDSRADGSCTFVSPLGYRYEHRPVTLLGEPPPEPD